MMSSSPSLATADSAVRVRILGDICIDGRTVTSDRIRALLVRLALAPGDIVSEAALMEAMWPSGAPKSARTSLQTHVGALRDLLEPDRARRSDGAYLFRRHGGYLLDLGDALDVSALRHAVERAETVRAAQPAVAASLLDRALDLWHERPLCEFEDAEWASGHVTTFGEYATRALVLRMELALESEAHADVIPRIEAGVALHPYNEKLIALLMLALHRSGRQADALAVFQSARRRLVEEFGVEPGLGLRGAEREVLGIESQTVGRIRNDKPPSDDTTHFVGRTRIQAELQRHLGERSLVTLVGPGGVGKSRLARRVIATLAAEWSVAAVFVDLSDVGPGQVTSVIAAELGVLTHPRLDLAQAVAAVIDKRETVLVLDTCEHIVDEVARVVDSLLGDPQLRVLTTSRTPLHHRSELIVEVPPLTTDDSISLLLDRAGMRQVSDSDRLALGEVCRRLDGLPLAIELAAGRLRTLTPRQLAQLIERGRAELHGGDDRPLRHRNLAETIAWSYRLLDPATQRALREIAVLRGPFTETSASSFWEDTNDGMLLDLVDRSLIARDSGDTLRFRMLDTVREFALGQAEQLGEREAVEARHASWVTRSVLTHRLTGEGLSATDVAAEIRPALEFLGRAGDPDELLLATTLSTWWVESAQIAEGRRRLEHALARHQDAASQLRTPAQALLGLLAWYQGDGRSARLWLHRVMPDLDDSGLGSFIPMCHLCLGFIEGRLPDAEQAAVELLGATEGNKKSRLLALFMAGNVAYYAGNNELALDRYLELRSLAERLEDSYQTALALRFQALATALTGEVDKAWALAERGVMLAASEGSPVGRSQGESILGLVAYLAGDIDGALVHATGAARLSRASLDSFSLRTALPVLAACLDSLGRHDVSALTIGWVQHLVEDSQLVLAPRSLEMIESATRHLDDVLGETGRRRLVARAAGLQLHELLEHVSAAA